MTDADRIERKRVNPEDFSTAMTAILSSHLKAHDRKDPVLVRSRGIVKEIERSKLEAKARRALKAEKKTKMDRERVIDPITGLTELQKRDLDDIQDAVKVNTEKEKTLKRTAKRGGESFSS